MQADSFAEFCGNAGLQRGLVRLDRARRLLDGMLAKLPGYAAYRPRELPDELACWVSCADSDELFSVVESCLARLITESRPGE